MTPAETCFLAVSIGDSCEQHIQNIINMAQDAEHLPLEELGRFSFVDSIKEVQ